MDWYWKWVKWVFAKNFSFKISIEGEPKKSDTLRDEYNELCSHLKSYLIEVTKEGCYSSAIGTYVLDHAFKSSPVYILHLIIPIQLKIY